MLASLYTTCRLPAMGGRFFKGVYPLPGGSATTIFHPENRPDGSFALVSDGRRFGEAGYYRIHRTDGGALRVKRMPMEETIHDFVDSKGAPRPPRIHVLESPVPNPPLRDLAPRLET